MQRPLAVLVPLLLVLTVGPSAQRAAVTLGLPTHNELFGTTKIVTVQLEFSQADYKALAPQSGGGWFGSFGGGGNSQSWLQGPDGKRNGFAASRGVQFTYVHGNATIDGQALRNIGVRYKGNGTYFDGAAAGKISLKLDFAEYVKGQRLGTLKKLNLHSNITDATWMNEVLAFRLFREAGVPALRTSCARVYVTIQGRQDRAYRPARWSRIPTKSSSQREASRRPERFSSRLPRTYSRISAGLEALQPDLRPQDDADSASATTCDRFRTAGDRRNRCAVCCAGRRLPRSGRNGALSRSGGVPVGPGRSPRARAELLPLSRSADAEILVHCLGPGSLVRAVLPRNAVVTSSSASTTRGPNRAASSIGCFASTRSRSSTSLA